MGFILCLAIIIPYISLSVCCCDCCCEWGTKRIKKKHSPKRDEFTHADCICLAYRRAFSPGATFGVIRLIWKIIGVKSKASRRVGGTHFKQSLSGVLVNQKQWKCK
jgi:hypothetical protein